GGDSRVSLSKMERITVGMQVEIKRSDGRIHGAVVTAVNKESGGVNVEWFENGETKGKEVTYQVLLQTNPTLNPDNLSLKSFKIPALPPKKEKELPAVSNGSRLPLQPQLTGARMPNRASMIGSLPLQPSTAQNRLSMNIPPPKPKSVASTPVDLDATQIFPVNVKLPTPKAEENLSQVPIKSSCVNEVEKLAHERERRRNAQAEAKRQQEALKSIDPGNPNWQFLNMICDYRSQVDFRPLKMDDAVVDNRITVCVRKRPMSKSEIGRKEIDVVTIPNKDHAVVHQAQVKVDMTKYIENQKFRFDYTFDENCHNEMVYKFTAKPLVQTIFNKGYATCFAYGQTGSGKTHTMGGDFHGKSQDCSKGIYALTAIDVFRMLQLPQYRNLGINVQCSFFEIYGGKVFDLLGKRAVLRILEDGNRSVQVCGLKEQAVESADDVMELIKKGSLQRTAGSTSANANSSRSHAVFQIILKHGKKDALYGKISLIDLAGNERGADTTSSDRQTRLEGAEINKSLLALKECIRAMSMNKKHIPFRLSKLTLVLRDSFTNQNAKTCMIAMVSPGLHSVENTLNTLRYADRVKELGSDEDGPTRVMSDEEFMLDENSPDEEDDETVNKLLMSATKQSKEVIEEQIMLNGLQRAEDKALDAHYDFHDAIMKTTNPILEKTANIDFDLDEYCRE
uniref:Kinesin-like protein n=1 Tax=Panagrolaimus sp. JU765 TaxID=591449 RepID=A0AC34RAB0_9BILA